MNYDFTLKAGDTYPYIQIGVVNENNSVVSFAGYQGAKFYMAVRSENSVTMVNGAAASATDSANGYFQYRWTVGDTSGYDGIWAFAYFYISMVDDQITRVPSEGYLDVYVGSIIG